MKSTLSTVALATLIAIASFLQAHAQTTHVSRVNVPFGFNRGSDHFAAGTYKIGIYDGGFLCLTDSNGRSSLMLAQPGPDSGSSTKPGYVAFRKYGNTYFLAGYHIAASGMTMTVGESKKERIVARDFASYSADTDTGRVRLALLNDGVSGR